MVIRFIPVTRAMLRACANIPPEQRYRLFQAFVPIERNAEAERLAFLSRPARVIERRHSAAVQRQSQPVPRRLKGPARRKRAISVSSAPRRQVIAPPEVGELIDNLNKNADDLQYHSSFHSSRSRSVALPVVKGISNFHTIFRCLFRQCNNDCLFF